MKTTHNPCFLRFMRSLFAPAVVCGFLVLALTQTACSPATDFRTTSITAKTPPDFDSWKIAATEKIPAAEMQEFNTCLDKIRLGVMMKNESEGIKNSTEVIAQGLCDLINGKTIHDVIVAGYTIEEAMLTKELERQIGNKKSAEKALAGPGSDEAKQGARQLYDLILQTIDQLEKRLENAKSRLAELQISGSATGKTPVPQ